MQGKKLSLCMIVKDEEPWIGRCLTSVKDVVDEMIVVDTGSTDRTPDIARSLGAGVYCFPWTGDFSEARNFGLEKASGDWILWLDADEEVDAGDANGLRQVLEHENSNLAFIELINFYGESPPNLSRVYRIAHHRLFRNGLGLKFNGAIHERLNVDEIPGSTDEVMQLDVKVYHYGYMDQVTQGKSKYERNLTMLLKAVEEPDPDPWVFYHLASEYYRVGQYTETFEYINQSIIQFLRKNLAPPSMLYKMKYSSLLATGSYDGAWPAIDKAISMYPDYVDLHFYKGVILLQKEMVQEAIPVFQHCLELGEDNLDYLTLRGVGSFQAWYYLGQCYEKEGQLEQATDAYRKVLSLSPDHPEAQQAYTKVQDKIREKHMKVEESRITISLCMIVRQEEDTLGRLLESVKDIVDEINIVDTGSTDKTKEVARQYTDRVFDFKWIDDFSAARNYSFSKATKQYVLWLDADDVLTEQDIERFKHLKQTMPIVDRVTMTYNLGFDAEGRVTTSLRRNRLVRRECNFQWIGAVHEYLAVGGTFLDSDVCITHHKEKVYTDRNLQIYRKRQKAGEKFSTRDLYYFANELRDHGFHEEAASYYEKMLDTGEGWIEDNIQACLKLAGCYSKIGNERKRFDSLTRALSYEIPRPEVSCAIGEYFFGEKRYSIAIFWYQLATEITPPSTMGITNRNAATWYPHLQLCLCYDRLGDYRKAFEHNEQALRFNPTHQSMLYNRNYFRDTHQIVPEESAD